MQFPKPYPPTPIDYEDWNLLVDQLEARFGPSAEGFIRDRTVHCVDYDTVSIIHFSGISDFTIYPTAGDKDVVHLDDLGGSSGGSLPGGGRRELVLGGG